MKEKLYTIPLNDAVNANDECPFCIIKRNVEQDLLDFVLGSGSSYMESDVRGITDKEGFCRNHFKKMFEYGNTLGNGWILKTHYVRMNQEMSEQFKAFSPKKSSLLNKRGKGEGRQNSIGIWAAEKENSCYICKQFNETYDRYMDTFFREKIEHSKGFCLHHFGDLCEAAESKLSNKEKTSFYPAMFSLMERNMKRMADDVAWLVEKFDYRNKDADWKASKDAVQRGMQKLKGGYPADPPYKMNK